MTVPQTHARGEALVRKWQPRLGLGDFRLQVTPMPAEPCGAWARSYYDLDEMWGVIDLPADDTVPPALLELLVLHELAHGLLHIAASGDTASEQACNRIARLARGDFETRLANEQSAFQLGDAYWGSGENEKLSYPLAGARPFERRAWLTLAAEALPEEERIVIALLYWDGLSLRDAADVLGVAHTTVEDRRNKALLTLRDHFEKLETATWNESRKVIPLRMPEGGAEHGVIYELHHRCSVANALIRTQEVGREDLDLLVFPVGNVGYGMPIGVPFGVQALGVCDACGQEVGCYFVWARGNVAHPGSIWTPS